ncbi:class I SAM-dependent methyltransferase [Streptomyces sp. NPDC008238]
MRRAFDRPAADYDDDHQDAVAATLIHLAAPSPADRRVPDVACGTGAVALALARTRSPADPAVLAVDVSAGMVAAGRARARRAAPSGAIDWRVADAVPLPCADGGLDLILCASSLHFLVARALADRRRALRPGGRVGYTLPLAPGFRASAALVAAAGLPDPLVRITRVGDRRIALTLAHTPA